MPLDLPDWPRSSTRTPTTRSASATPSWRPSRRRTTGTWIARTDGSVIQTLPARELLHQAAEAAALRRPGRPVRHDDQLVVHAPEHGRINASNPCSEYMSIDDSACNLAHQPDEVPPRGRRPRSRPSSTPSTVFLAARRSSSATRATRRPRSVRTRRPTGQLGLGYANLGALLMSARGFRTTRTRAALRRRRHRAYDRSRLYRKSAEIAGRMARSPATSRTPAP